MLTDEQIETVKSYADGAYRVMRELGIDHERLDELLRDENVERCQNMLCGWYDESGSMLNSAGEVDGYCENCRKYDAPEEEAP